MVLIIVITLYHDKSKTISLFREGAWGQKLAWEGLGARSAGFCFGVVFDVVDGEEVRGEDFFFKAIEFLLSLDLVFFDLSF